jgi:hypothetical protein
LFSHTIFNVVLLPYPEFNNCRISATYYDPTEAKARSFGRTFKLTAVPAQLTRGLVRLGGSNAFLSELTGGLRSNRGRVSEVRHEEVHTDIEGYDD